MIVGAKGKVTFSCLQSNPVTLVIGDEMQEFMIEHPAHVQQPLIESIVAELLGYGKSPSTGISGARTNWVLEKLCNR